MRLILTVFLCSFAGGCTDHCAELETRLRTDLGDDYAYFDKAGGMATIAPDAAPRRLRAQIREVFWPQRQTLCEAQIDDAHYQAHTLPQVQYMAAFQRDPVNAGPAPQIVPPRPDDGSWLSYAVAPLAMVGALAFALFNSRRRSWGAR